MTWFRRLIWRLILPKTVFSVTARNSTASPPSDRERAQAEPLIRTAQSAPEVVTGPRTDLGAGGALDQEMGQGVRPTVASGRGPGTGPGTGAGTAPGHGPGTARGYGPGTAPGAGPGTAPNTGPGTEPPKLAS